MVEQELIFNGFGTKTCLLLRPVKCHKTNSCMYPWIHVSLMLICISVVLISTMIYSFYQIFHLWERLARRVLQGQQRNYLQENLKTVERKFPSGYFNSVYSCLRFLFPVLLSMLPALPFLLFLHHYCPLLAKKETLSIVETTSSLSAVTQEFPHRSETHLGTKWQTTDTSKFRFSIQEGCQTWQRRYISKRKLPFSSNVLCGVFYPEASVD